MQIVLLLSFISTQFDFQNTVIRSESECFKDVFSLSSVQDLQSFSKKFQFRSVKYESCVKSFSQSVSGDSVLKDL